MGIVIALLIVGETEGLVVQQQRGWILDVSFNLRGHPNAANNPT
jgi:hypothetical protein